MSRGARALRLLRKGERARAQPLALMFAALVFGYCSMKAPGAGLLAAGAIGALFTINARVPSRLLALVLAAGLFLPAARTVPTYWMTLAVMLLAGFAPAAMRAALLHLPRSSWQLALVVTTPCACGMFLGLGVVPNVLGMLGAFYLGINIARHMARADARLLAWGDGGLAVVTRDLLLGRVTSGMLHDLAQPLNVISMANGNMGYIIDHLAIGDEERRQLLERIERISNHTQAAALILSLFRWFGRDGSDDPAALTVRSALDRAVAATRSNVRHNGVAVELQGNALDYLLPTRHGALEMMAVAALLCAFASYLAADGTKKRGKVLLHASLSRAHLVVSVQCVDTEGRPVAGKPMDHATNWLVEQVAHEAGGDFRCLVREARPERFLIRLGRDDL
jgi:signal transduction histidine kinase